MKMFRIIRTSLRDAFKSVFRNFSLSMASISCTTITLILVSISLLVTYNVNSITKNIENVLTIVAFVDENAKDTDIARIKENIIGLNNVDTKELVYNSKEDIKAELSKDEDIKDILDALDTNPVQSSFVIKVKDVTKMTNTASKIKEIEGITQIKYGENIVNKLISMFDVVRNGCIVAVFALIIVTAFLIGNTIKITIFSRRQEISIMRLVGTSNIVIKFPFMIGGFILGLIGAIIPVLLTIYGYTYFYDSVGGKMFSDLIELVEPSTIIYSISLILVIIGIIVGMIGSLRAVRRYLKI